MLRPKLAPRVLAPPILILAGLALCGSALRADIIYSNFGTDFAYSDGTAVIVADGQVDKSVAEELPTLTNSFNLTSIEFVASSPNPDPSNWVKISIFADANGIPGGDPLESITLNGQLAPFNGSLSPVLTATSVLNPTLNAGSRYWIVMDGSPTEQLNWDQNSIGTSGFTETDGTAGNYPPAVSNPNADETNGVFEVDGTLVQGSSGSAAPEPGTWLLMLAGMSTLAVVRQSRR